MSRANKLSTKLTERAQCYQATSSALPHKNVRLPGALCPFLLSAAHRSQPNNCRRCEMNAAMNCGQAKNLSNSFNPGCHSQESEARIADTEMSRHSYFSICAPLSDMPSGNRFPYGVCGPFLDENEAFDALEALQAKMPKRKLAVMYGQNFFDAPDVYLRSDQELARAKLVALLTAE